MNTWSALSPSTERGIGKKLLKAYHRTRRDFPLVNFMVVYGVKQAGAALFLADIVRSHPPQLLNCNLTRPRSPGSAPLAQCRDLGGLRHRLLTNTSTHRISVLQISDILVTGAFIRKANLAEICEPHPARARAIAAFSMIFILIPLVLTALFITRVHIRGYVRRKQLQEMQKTLQGSATATQPFLGGSAAVDTSHLPDIYTANLAPPSTPPSHSNHHVWHRGECHASVLLWLVSSDCLSPRFRWFQSSFPAPGVIRKFFTLTPSMPNTHISTQRSHSFRLPCPNLSPTTSLATCP